jgi:hypothetical protein
MLSVRTVALLAFVVGLVLGGAVVAATVPDGPGDVDPDSPQYSIASGTGCIGDTGGWAGVVSEDRGRTVAINLTVAHDADRNTETRFTHAGDGRYLFALTTTDDGKAGSPDCPAGTTTELVATLPTDFESVTVVRDGETLATVENPEDGVSFRTIEAESA